MADEIDDRADADLRKIGDACSAIKTQLLRIEKDHDARVISMKEVKLQLAEISTRIREQQTHNDQIVADLPTFTRKRITDLVSSVNARHAALAQRINPRQKFTFKTKVGRPIASDSGHAPTQLDTADSSARSSGAPTPTVPPTSTPAASPQCSAVPAQEPTPYHEDSAGMLRLLPVTSTILVENQSSKFLYLDGDGMVTTYAASIRGISSSVIDLACHRQTFFSTLLIKSTSQSLLLLGHVDGPLHLTGLSNSIVVASCRQFRMHESSGVEVYLACGSEPIIERCTNITFAELPERYSRLENGASVDGLLGLSIKDFDWVGTGQSPNWRRLRPGEAKTAETWRKVDEKVCSREDVLRSLDLL